MQFWPMGSTVLYGINDIEILVLRKPYVKR